MKKIEGFNVPESWQDITISNLIRLQDLKMKNNIESHFEVIRIFNKKDPAKADFITVMNVASAIYQAIQNSPQMNEQKDNYTIKGKVYHLKTIEEIDFQTFLDFQGLTANIDDWERINNLGLLLAILTKNAPKDLRSFADTIAENVSVADAASIMIFFSENLTNYLENTQLYLSSQEKIKSGQKEIKK